MTPKPITRRQVLKQSFFFSATMLAGKGLLRAADVPASASASHFLMIGDWGWNDDLQGQTAVAKGMARYVTDTAMKPEALFLIGDNFYGPFKGGTDCPRWKTQFSDMYPKSVFPGPCHAILGNHDYDDEPVASVAAQLGYAKAQPGTRWNMPAKWYRIELTQAGKPLASVLMLDSNYHNKVVSLTPQEKSDQLAWLKAELEKPSAAPWRVVMGHHPLFSSGAHGDNPEIITAWDKLFREHKVHFYFAGHDHDLQHLEFEKHPTSFVISGGGGARVREPQIGSRGPFAAGIYGFTHLEITPQRFIVRHLDANRNLLHAFAKLPDGSWSPLA